jgi:hypothetical protein
MGADWGLYVDKPQDGVLPGPLCRGVAQVGHTDAARQASFHGCLTLLEPWSGASHCALNDPATVLPKLVAAISELRQSTIATRTDHYRQH